MMAATSHALEITLTPGSLRSELPTLVNTQDRSLVLKGRADVTDLALLKNMSRAVTTLDMSGLRIAAYTYTDGDYLGSVSFSDDEIPPRVLAGSAVTMVKFPASVSVIGESAFAGSSLRTVVIPSTVKRIDDYAFAGCKQLGAVRFVGNPELGTGILKDCVSLTLLETVVDLTDIPASMFDGCSSYATAPSADVVSVGDYAYRGTAVERLDLLCAERLGDFCFADMSSLTEVNIDLSHDLEVGTGAFFNDGALGMLPSWPGDTPGLALAYSRGRQKEAIHSEMIGEAAYANNTDIEYVKLGSGVRRIGAHAFRNLTALEQVDVTDLGTLMPDVDPLAFSGLENGEGRYDIILNVAKETNDHWAGHPVWGLFNINNMDTGIVDTPGNVPHVMTVSREGMSVSVVSSLPVDYLGVFALDGTVIHESRPATEKCEVYLPDGPDVLIVKAVSGTYEKVVKLR